MRILITDIDRHNTTDEQWNAARPLLSDPIKRVFWPREPGEAMAIHTGGERFCIDAYGQVTKSP